MKLELLQAIHNGKQVFSETEAGGVEAFQPKADALQELADEFGLIITVTHYPPGASKWNPIDHRMFSLISGNWAGEPLVSYPVILHLIRKTRSSKGFHCRARLDTTEYPTKFKATPATKERVRLKPRLVLPKWNYTIWPRSESRKG